MSDGEGEKKKKKDETEEEEKVEMPMELGMFLPKKVGESSDGRYNDIGLVITVKRSTFVKRLLQ